MSFSVKTIINDAYDRSGIFPNPGDALPGEMASMGLTLLQGLVSQYNISNYIVSTQRLATVKVPASGVIRLNKDSVDDDVAGIVKVYAVVSQNNNEELDFTAFMTWPKYTQVQTVYSFNQVEEYGWDLYVSQRLAGRELVVCYVVPFECNMDTVYYLSTEYKELFTLGLCVKLLGAYPREDKTMLENLGGELQSLTGAIKAKQAEAKTLEWNTHDYVSTRSAFESGSFLVVK